VVVETLEDGHRLPLSLDHHAVELPQAVDTVQAGLGRLRDEGARAVVLARALQPRGDVDAVADDGEAIRLALPMLPAPTESVFRPIPISIVGSCACSRSAFHSVRLRIMAIAARRARSASSFCATGRPNAAMIASPMNLLWASRDYSGPRAV